tara:strand:- start:718 stop:1644 length:927 start_codon:yes stop_codon:yes gene_type:complete
VRILVTGGAGFIGSNLCEFLFKKKHSIIVLDDLSSGNLSNLTEIYHSINFHNQQVEKFNFEVCGEIDIVVHLAAQASVPLSIEKFGESTKTNLIGTIKVIDYCSQNNIPLVYASSSAVYGGLSLGDDIKNNIDLMSPYAVDKYVMELYAEVASKIYALSSVGLRFFNVYGPRQNPSSAYSGVISIFVDRLLSKKPIYVNGGSQTRDFVYVSDVVKSIYNAMLLVQKNSISDHINILTGQSVSIDELSEILVKEIDLDAKVYHRELSVGDPLESKGTTEKMVNILGINLSDMTSLGNGLSKTINFVRGV